MTKFIPSSFNQAQVVACLHQAMGFGEATRAGDKATFYKVTQPEVVGPTDQEGLPFNPEVSRPSTATPIVVPCAIEFFDRAEDADSYGVLQASRVKLTLLDEDYQKVKGFRYVVAGGDKYFYAKTEPTIALGSIDVWIIHCTAQDER